MAIISIEKFIEGLDYDHFKLDDKTSSAAIRNFEIIGEATKNISNDIRNQYSQIHLKKMAGVRERD